MPALREGVPSGRAAHPAGRRRAPGTAEFPAVPVALFGTGRHRAPSVSGAGRHRAADTGTLPVVPEVDATCEMPRAWASRLDDDRPGRRAPRAALGAAVPEPDLLTRPMRLGDLLPERYEGRLDDTLTGV
jgi:hypothetical protein